MIGTAAFQRGGPPEKRQASEAVSGGLFKKATTCCRTGTPILGDTAAPDSRRSVLEDTAGFFEVEARRPGTQLRGIAVADVAEKIGLPGCACEKSGVQLR